MNLREKLDEATVAAHKALDDYINGVRNAPGETLETQMHRARAMHQLLHVYEHPDDPLDMQVSMMQHANDQLSMYPEKK